MSKSLLLIGESLVFTTPAVVDDISAMTRGGIHSPWLSFTRLQSVFDGVIVSEDKCFVWFWANKGDLFQSF